MQNLILALIGLAAFFLAGRIIYRTIRGRGGCGCGPDTCPGDPSRSGRPCDRSQGPPCCR